MNVFENNIVELNNGEMDENRESFNVLHCDGCHRSYEMGENYPNCSLGVQVHYHVDFPTFGLERKTCFDCN